VNCFTQYWKLAYIRLCKRCYSGRVATHAIMLAYGNSFVTHDMQ